MLRPVLLFIFLNVFISNALQSQEVKFGVKGGLNHSWLIGDTNENFGARYSYHLGVFSDFALKNKWSFRPELIYSRQGSKFKGSFNVDDLNPGVQEVNNSFEFVFGSDYLQLPLLLRIQLTDFFALDFGPQIGVSVNGDSKLDYGPTFDVDFKLQDRMNLQLRYYFGVSDLFRTTVIGGSVFDDDFLNSVVQLSIGYRIF